MSATIRKTSERTIFTKRLLAACFFSALIQVGIGTPGWGVEPPKKELSEAGKRLAADVVSPDKKLREKTFIDLINGVYKELDGVERLAAILPALQTLDPDPHSSQGAMIQSLPRILDMQGKGALPILLAHIANEKIAEYFRSQAMTAAAKIAPQDPQVLAAIVKVAMSSNEMLHNLQCRAIEDLGELGTHAESSLPILKELLSHKNRPPQDYAFEALGRITIALAPERDFADSFLAKEPALRAAAHQQLRTQAEEAQSSSRPKKGQLRTFANDRTLKILLEVLETHPDDYDRTAALKTLSVTGPGGDPRMIQALLKLAGVSPFTPSQTLARLDPIDPAAVDVLLESLRRTKQEPRGIATMAAVRGLQKYGIHARPAVPDLLAGFDRLIVIRNHEFADDEVRDYLATLAAADPTNEAVLTRILDLLAADHPLNHPQPPYHPVAPLILEVLTTIGLPADAKFHEIAVARITTALANSQTASVAANVLENTDSGILTADASVFVPQLVKILEAPRPRDEQDHKSLSRNGQTAVAALRALARFGSSAESTLPLLKKLAAREILSTYDMHDMWENGITKEARKSIAAITQP